MASAPDSDTWGIPTCVGKLGIDSFVAFVISGHPHQGGEVRVVVLMIAPAWRGLGAVLGRPPNPRIRTRGDPNRVPPSPETLMSIIHELPGGRDLCETSGADDVSSLVPQLRVRVKEVTPMRRAPAGDHRHHEHNTFLGLWEILHLPHAHDLDGKPIQRATITDFLFDPDFRVTTFIDNRPSPDGHNQIMRGVITNLHDFSFLSGERSPRHL